jgi:hypothetical protein
MSSPRGSTRSRRRWRHSRRRSPRSDRIRRCRAASPRRKQRRKTLGDSLAALNRRVDAIAATTGNALARADAATAAVEAAKSAAQQSGVQRADLDALANRVAAIEGAMNRLAAIESAVKAVSDNLAKVERRPASADDRAARTTVAARRCVPRSSAAFLIRLNLPR